MLDVSGADWRKSSHSAEGNCVEVAFLGDRVAIRNSNDRQGPMLVFSSADWRSFLKSVRDREFDLP
jgi:Domain of unknown function (DUF397)